MKYDDASWHSEGEFPADRPPSAGATHIALFASWAMLHGFAGDLHRTELADKLRGLKDRIFTPTAWLLATCDGKLTSEDLNDEGNAFARAYYVDIIDGKQAFGPYYDDVDATFGELFASYRIPDTWEAYDRIDHVITARLAEWRQAR